MSKFARSEELEKATREASVIAHEAFLAADAAGKAHERMSKAAWFAKNRKEREMFATLENAAFAQWTKALDEAIDCRKVRDELQAAWSAELDRILKEGE